MGVIAYSGRETRHTHTNAREFKSPGSRRVKLKFLKRKKVFKHCKILGARVYKSNGGVLLF